jgi:hypothetical protein
MLYSIDARDGSHGDFVHITIKARNMARAMLKLRVFGLRNGFNNLKALIIYSQPAEA